MDSPARKTLIDAPDTLRDFHGNPGGCRANCDKFVIAEGSVWFEDVVSLYEAVWLAISAHELNLMLSKDVIMYITKYKEVQGNEAIRNRNELGSILDGLVSIVAYGDWTVF